MSFILDALKKSETERQQQAGGEFSSVPSSSGDQQSFRWLWILGLLLLVNVIFERNANRVEDVPRFKGRRVGPGVHVHRQVQTPHGR